MPNAKVITSINSETEEASFYWQRIELITSKQKNLI